MTRPSLARCLCTAWRAQTVIFLPPQRPPALSVRLPDLEPTFRRQQLVRFASLVPTGPPVRKDAPPGYAPPREVNFNPRKSRQPIFVASCVGLKYYAEPVPRRQEHARCRKLLLTGPRGSVPVYIPPYLHVWLEEADQTAVTAAQATDTSDPNNLGDPTALGANMRRLWMRPDDLEDRHQLEGWYKVHLHISAAVTGVTEGYRVPVRINGVGYRVTLNEPSEPGGRPVLSCKLGYPNTFEHPLPEGVDITLYNATNFILFGPDRERLLEFAMAVRAHRKPEPYKLKGVFVDGETIKKKEGKKGKR